MDGIDELIEAGLPWLERHGEIVRVRPFASAKTWGTCERRSEEGREGRIRDVPFQLSFGRLGEEVTVRCKTWEKKSLVTVGMTGLGKSPGTIYLYHCVSSCSDLNHNASHESQVPQFQSRIGLTCENTGPSYKSWKLKWKTRQGLAAALPYCCPGWWSGAKSFANGDWKNNTLATGLKAYSD